MTDLQVEMFQDNSWSDSFLTIIKFNDLNRETELQFPAGCVGGACPNNSSLTFTEDKQSITCAGVLDTFCNQVSATTLSTLTLIENTVPKTVVKYSCFLFQNIDVFTCS